MTNLSRFRRGAPAMVAGLAVLALSFGLTRPGVVHAADIVTFDTDTSIANTGVELVVLAGSQADEVIIDTGTLTVDVDTGDTFTLRSETGVELANDGGLDGCEVVDGFNQVTVTGPAVVIFTPAAGCEDEDVPVDDEPDPTPTPESDLPLDDEVDSPDPDPIPSDDSDAELGITTDTEGRRWAPDSGATGPSPFDGSIEAISTVEAGWYIRGENYDTVYYVSGDDTRRPFWDATAFMTWADSWDEVVWVTDATLPTLAVTEPMLAQSGVVMVKVASDPKVYMVEIDPVSSDYELRHVTTETIAISMFGSAWADFIIDVESTTFTHYAIGDEIVTEEIVDTDIMKTRTELVLLVNPDIDGDGLSADEEAEHGTDAFDFDSDDDGFSDGVEVSSGYDPLED